MCVWAQIISEKMNIFSLEEKHEILLWNGIEFFAQFPSMLSLDMHDLFAEIIVE